MHSLRHACVAFVRQRALCACDSRASFRCSHRMSIWTGIPEHELVHRCVWVLLVLPARLRRDVVHALCHRCPRALTLFANCSLRYSQAPTALYHAHCFHMHERAHRSQAPHGVRGLEMTVSTGALHGRRRGGPERRKRALQGVRARGVSHHGCLSSAQEESPWRVSV
jgi:hypothetical protein